MALKKRDGRAAVGAVQLWRATTQRLSSLALAMMAIALLVAGRVDAPFVERLRARTGDVVAPLLGLAQHPISAFNEFSGELRHLQNLAGENARLRTENERLRQWQDGALKLEAENGALRALLNFRPDPSVQARTARVVGDFAGQYVRSVLVKGGSKDGIAKGQAAMSGAGLVGRVTEVGWWSSRVLLLNDLNSRIPVVIEESRDRAIVVGDNSDYPRLMYLPQDSRIAPGQRVVTSGHDGVFPAGLPVGVVRTVKNGEVRIAPLADFGRLELLQLIDTGASALTPETAPAAPAPPPRPHGRP